MLESAAARRGAWSGEGIGMLDKLVALAPRRLSAVLAEGLRGHHLLFSEDEIRGAFAAPDAQLTRAQADAVGAALLAVCRDPIDVARVEIEALAPDARAALVRLYFRLLERAVADGQQRH